MCPGEANIRPFSRTPFVRTAPPDPFFTAVSTASAFPGQDLAGTDMIKRKEGDACNFIAEARGSETMRRNCEEGRRVRDWSTYEQKDSNVASGRNSRDGIACPLARQRTPHLLDCWKYGCGVHGEEVADSFLTENQE